MTELPPARACGRSFCLQWLDRASASFEGEDLAGRLARRKRNGIAEVRLAES
jgi:hypothetical protein